MKTLDELLDEGKTFKQINNYLKSNTYEAGWYEANGKFTNMKELEKCRCVQLNNEYIGGENLLTFGDNEKMEDIDRAGGGFVVPICDYIFDSVFKESNIEEIILPDGLKELGAGVFRGSNLGKIFIPKSLEDLGYASFSDTPRFIKIFYEGSEEDFWKLKQINESDIKVSNINFNCKLSDIEFKFIKQIEKNIER